MPNVLIASYYDFESGGTGISTYFIAKNLEKRGYKIFLASKRQFPELDTFIFKNLRFFPLFFFRDIYLYFFLSKIIKEKEINLILASDYRFSFLGCLKAATKNKIPMVLYLRDYWFKCLKGDLLYKNSELCDGMKVGKCLKCLPTYLSLWEVYKFHYFQKKLKLVKKVNAILAVSSFVADEMVKTTEGSKVRPEIIYDLFEKRDNNKIRKKIIDKYTGKIKVLFAGKLIYHRGIGILMQVAKEISKRNKNIVFLIVGSGEAKLKCLEFIEKNELKNIELFGEIDYGNMDFFYDISDIVYFPSILPEPLGRTVIESMVYGKTVIASDVGGIKEVITNNKDGYLVKTGCIEEHTEKILELASDDEKRSIIGEAAKKRSLDFSSDKFCILLEKIFDKLLEKKNF